MKDKSGQEKILDVLALGNSIGTGPKGINANVVEVKSFDDLYAKGDSVKGKIVFFNYKFNPRFVGVFQAYADAVRYRRRWPQPGGQIRSRRSYCRSMSESTDNNPHTGSLRYETTLPKIPAVAIGLKDADSLVVAFAHQKVDVYMKTGGKFFPDTIDVQ